MRTHKILFLFNQLTLPTLCTGGEIRGYTIANYFQNDKNFKTKIVTSEVGSQPFKKFKKIIIGHQSLEKYLNHQSLFSSFILFFERTIESIFKISFLKSDIIYSTGDFFCNIIPAFFTKIIYPKTKNVVCIHHINENPFNRKTNSYLSGIVSYLIQRLSFFLIKHNFDLIFVVNNQVKQYFIQKKFTQPIVVVGNGLDIETTEKEIKTLYQVKPTDNISYFGRLSGTKGSLDLPIILSKMLKKYPNIHLDLIGAALPEIKKNLVKKFTQLNCQNHYTIHDFIPKKSDVFKILLKSKVILFPSYEEGWGISLFESIMTKRPVVAYDLPVFKELFKTKLITAPIGDINTFAQKVDYLFQNYQSKTTKKYINECYSVVKKYDWKNVFLKEKKSIINLFE